MRTTLLFISILLISFACKPKQEVSQNTTPVVMQPEWVKGKPSSSLYFQGIGVATKSTANLDYIENAKKSALNDLASEIVVNVSSNSLLYTLEREYKFQTEFIETINTTTNLELEGYETAGTWEDDKQYFIFFRLNKSDYYAKKALEKQQAIERAADFHKKGLDAWNNQQVKSALDLQMNGLLQLKKYWAESNEYNFEGKTVLLDNEIFKSIQDIATGIQITPTPDKLTLKLSNAFSQNCNLMITDKQNGAVLNGIPVSYSYRSSNGTINENATSASGGSITIAVEKPDRLSNYNELKANVDLEKMMDIKSLDKQLLILLRGLETAKIKVPIDFERPIFYVESREQNLNNRQLLSYLKEQLSNELIKAGMTLSHDKGAADIIVKINGQTRQGGESNGFSIAYLNMNLSFTDKSGNVSYFESNFNDIKGVGNDFEQAGIKAFEKAKEMLNSKYTNNAINTVI
jgi:hypothetical protein